MVGETPFTLPPRNLLALVVVWGCKCHSAHFFCYAFLGGEWGAESIAWEVGATPSLTQMGAIFFSSLACAANFPGVMQAEN